ncbi:MAG: VOC family protein [Chloroflexi bacterium]|nr:VOC family protein [Chloroflexota bacterium]
MSGGIVEIGAVTVDVNDLEREAEFWRAMIGEEPGPARGGGGWLTIGNISDGVLMALQKVPEPKTIKDRIHFDFQVDDVDEAITRIIELGGTQLSEPRAGGGVTMADPEGNEFCIGSFRRNKEGVRRPL